MTSPRGNFENIAIIRLSSVGDVIMALPALEGLRATYPRARITWIVESRARNILEGNPALDEIIDFPRTRWRTLWKRRFGVIRSVPEIADFYLRLKKRHFDLTIDFQGNLKSATCALWARASTRIGFAKEECREPNHYFSTRTLSLGGQAIHRIDRDLLLVGLVGVPFRFQQPRIAFTPEDRRVGLEVIPTPRSGPPVAVLHPGTSDFMPHKRWPLESYARLGDVLVREAGARVLLSFGPGEEPMIETLSRQMEEESEIIPSTPTIKSLGFLLSRADLVIGGDTGPVHLAVLMGVDTLDIMGPSDPRFYYPYRHPDRVFYRRAPCSPCRHRACATLECLWDIHPNEVAKTAVAILRARTRISSQSRTQPGG